MKLRKTLAGILGAVVMLLGVGTFEHINRETGVKAADQTWKLITNAESLEVGDQVIIASKNADFAMSTTQNGNNRAQAAVTKNDNTLTPNNSVQVLTLESGTKASTFAFNTGSGYLYAASFGSNHLKTQDKIDDNASWQITIAEETGVATIKAQGTNTRNWMRYNSSNNPPIFSCYSSGQADVVIYELEGEKLTPEQQNSNSIQGMISSYFNKGVYTKKSNIYLNSNAEFDVNSVMHSDEMQPMRLDRTTYYKDDVLFMANLDGSIGGEGQINSGYKTEGSDLRHFTLDSNKEEVPGWTVQNTTLKEFFVTLDNFMVEDYFIDWDWNKDTKVATYTINGDAKDNGTVMDFVNFGAPCLENLFDEKTSKFFTLDKLTISEATNGRGEKHLSMKIYVHQTNSGVLKNEDTLILSEARIYAGNIEFDEDTRNVSIDAALEGGSIECDTDINKPVKIDTKLTLTITVDANYVVESFTINGSDKKGLIDVNNGGKITWTVEADTKIVIRFKSTLISEDIIFELGANGSATHDDGSSKSTYTETVNGYTLNITGGTNMYTEAIDAKGNSCIKLGTGSKTGSFKFTVPEDVQSVVIYVAKYKANTSKVTINGTTHTLTKNSNDGAYDKIVVDTKTNKTVTVTSVSGGIRAMINSIEFVK